MAEPTLLFPPFRLDSVNACLWRETTKIVLMPKDFAVLHYLVAHPGQLVTHKELLTTVWPDTVVNPGVLKVCLRRIRQALQDEATAPRFIETVHRRGYRFIAPVTTAQPGQRAKGKGQSPQPSTPHTLHPTPHLVGREAELAQLHDWLAKALNGERQIVFVTGEAGLGKTTLVEAFLDQIAAEGIVWVGRGQCIEHYGTGEAYMPVLEALGRLCREPGNERLIALLGQHAPTWLIQMPALLQAADFEVLQRKVLGTTRERMLREMAEAIETLTAERPLVLWLEDLPWSDVSTLQLLAFLARRREQARLLVIGTYRPVEVLNSRHPLRAVAQELQAHGLCTELALALLSEADIADYLHTCFPVNALPSGLARTLYRRTEGNPLFLVNTLDDLIARGIITQDEGRWVLRDGVKVIELGVPESIRQLIVKQSERLLPAERQVLEAASVAGMQFSAAAVAAALEADVVEVEELCAGLAQRQQFLRPAGISEWPDGTVAARYGFLHALYQEVLYEGVTTGKWARLHQRIGKRLEVAYRNRTEEVAVELAIHFEQGRDISRAVRYLGQAAENALRRSANVEAITHLTKGLELLTLLPDTPARARHELTFQLALGAPLTATKGWAAPEVGNAYRRARELCQRVGNAQQLFQALFGLWVFAYTRAELRPARELAEQLLSLARKSRDAVLLTEAHHALGNTLHRMGELTIARTHLEQGLVLSESRQAHPYALLYGLDNGVAGLGYVTWVLWQLGYPDQALQRAQAMLLRARQSAYPLSMAWALNAAAWHHQARREGRQAQEQAETEIVLCHEQGFSQLGAVGTIARGWALAVQGQAEEGIGQMRQGLADHRATGAEIGRPRYLALLAEAYGQAGQAAEGLRVLDEALKTAHDTGERFYEAELYRLKGELTLQQFKVQSSRFKVKTSPNQVEGKSKPSRGKSGVQKLHH